MLWMNHIESLHHATAPSVTARSLSWFGHLRDGLIGAHGFLLECCAQYYPDSDPVGRLATARLLTTSGEASENSVSARCFWPTGAKEANVISYPTILGSTNKKRKKKQAILGATACSLSHAFQILITLLVLVSCLMGFGHGLSILDRDALFVPKTADATPHTTRSRSGHSTFKTHTINV